MPIAPLSHLTSSLHQPRSLLPPTIMSLSSSSLSQPNISDPRDSLLSSSSSLNLEIVGARRSLLSKFDSLRKPYKPFPIVGWNRHVETIFAAFFRSLPAVTLRRECLRTKDDGAVALDWVSGDDRQLPFDSPLLILLFYSASFTDDLRHVVDHVSTRYPKSNIYAISWSLGANILVRYLGQESYNCPLSGAVSLCNPFNLVIADEDFRKGFNNVYDKALARSLRNIFRKHALLFEGLSGEYNIPMAANARTVKEFDEGLTRVSFGFKSADDYYFNSSSSNSVGVVRTPLLCIQAANDPIAPSRGIPRAEIQENPHCLLIVTSQGGHLGWVVGDEAPVGAPWTNAVVMEFLEHLREENNSNRSNFCEENVHQDSLSISVHTL